MVLILFFHPKDQAQLSCVQRVRFHRGDHAAYSRQVLSDDALLRLVLQQDARAAQEACRGGTGGDRAQVRSNSRAGVWRQSKRSD